MDIDTNINANYDYSTNNHASKYEITIPGDDEEVSQNSIHAKLLKYLVAVLTYMFVDTDTGIYDQLQIFGDPENPEQSKSPDVMVIPHWPDLPGLYRASYRVGENMPPPPIVFEVSSPSNWQQDVEPDQKPAVYARIGIQEYFAYDPYTEQVWTDEYQERGRLIGWHLVEQGQPYQFIEPDAQGRLWSETLQSWLVADNELLRLYTQDGQLRATDSEAEHYQRLQIRAEADQLSAHLEHSEMERLKERQRAEKLEAERLKERQRAEKLAALLRQLGINPDDV